MRKSELNAFFKYSGLLLLVFVIAILIQVYVIRGGHHPKFLALPILVSLFVSFLFGYTAVLRLRLQKSNLAKSEFLSRMSHELRTPLNAILGFAQVIGYEAVAKGDHSQEENADEILVAGSHLLELIDELLNLSKIDAGRIDITIDDVNLCQVLHECLTIVDPLAKKREIDVRVTEICRDGCPIVRADRVRTREVMLNLLSNAVKYNRRGGWVEISCLPESDGMLRLSVTDSGFGIPEEDLEDIFLPFSRGQQQQSSIEGIGIGLGITRKLVELMGGSIGCKSEVNRGSTFWVDLVESEAQ